MFIASIKKYSRTFKKFSSFESQLIYSNALHRGFELRSFRQKIDTSQKFRTMKQEKQQTWKAQPTKIASNRRKQRDWHERDIIWTQTEKAWTTMHTCIKNENREWQLILFLVFDDSPNCSDTADRISLSEPSYSFFIPSTTWSNNSLSIPTSKSAFRNRSITADGEPDSVPDPWASLLKSSMDFSLVSFACSRSSVPPMKRFPISLTSVHLPVMHPGILWKSSQSRSNK